MNLEFVGPYYALISNPERATKPGTCGTCSHGLVDTMLLSNSRDFVWCNVGQQKEARHAISCSVYKDIWKKL